MGVKKSAEDKVKKGTQYWSLSTPVRGESETAPDPEVSCSPAPGEKAGSFPAGL